MIKVIIICEQCGKEDERERNTFYAWGSVPNVESGWVTYDPTRKPCPTCGQNMYMGTALPEQRTFCSAECFNNWKEARSIE